MSQLSEEISKGLTKAVAKVQDKINEQNNSLFDALTVEEQKPGQVKPMTHEEVCEESIRQAHEKGLPEPDFDYRNFYTTGQVIYFIHVLKGNIKTKQLKKLTVRTIYPRMLVCLDVGAACQCISYKDKDYIFDNMQNAQPLYDSIELTAEETKPSSKHEVIEEDDSEDKTDYEALKHLD